MIAQIRKAIIATLAAFLTGFAPAWAQAGGFPGWDTVGGLAIFAALSGLGVWAVPNARPKLPPSAEHLGPPPATVVSTAAARAHARAAKDEARRLDLM